MSWGSHTPTGAHLGPVFVSRCSSSGGSKKPAFDALHGVRASALRLRVSEHTSLKSISNTRKSQLLN